jgi:hypothetical protein
VALAAARDIVGCRFRAPSQFGAKFRDLALVHAGEHLAFAGLERIVSSASQDGIPGDDLFLEHVQYNLAVHRLLARELSRSILQSRWNQAWDPTRDLADAELDHRIGLLDEDALSGLSFALQILQTLPLAGAVGSEQVQNALSRQIEQLYSSLPAERRDRFADLSMQDMQRDLVSALDHQAIARRVPEFR